LAALTEPEDIEAFAAELVDRFGPVPQETEQLLKLVGIKQLCRKAGVAKVEAGPKGIVLAFHNDRFARPDRLVGFISARAQRMKLRPDHRLVITEPTATPQERLKRARDLVDELARIAA
jgi:transcription-repair coupling factor (superfamily II helicase)